MRIFKNVFNFGTFSSVKFATEITREAGGEGGGRRMCKTKRGFAREEGVINRLGKGFGEGESVLKERKKCMHLLSRTGVS